MGVGVVDVDVDIDVARVAGRRILRSVVDGCWC